MPVQKLITISNSREMKYFTTHPSNYLLILLFLIFNSLPSKVFGGEITVHLTNAISGQALANKEIYVYQQQADSALKRHLKNGITTDAQGEIVLDLPGLGSGNKYQFRTNPYHTGYVHSTLVNTAGTFDFKVGKLEAKIIKGDSSSPLASHKITIWERLTDSKLKWAGNGLTDANGIIRFDIPNLGSGKKYVLTAINPFDGKTKYSNVITQNGKVTFTVGNQLLTVHLTNAISGQTLANKEMIVYQQQADGSLKWHLKKNTDTQGKIVLDLPELGAGTQYQFRTTPYTTGKVYSDLIKTTGIFDFKVGNLEAKIVRGDSGKLMANYKVTARELLADGKSKWIANGLTDVNGIIRFDIPDLSNGKKFVLSALNPFDGKTKYSTVITQNGKVTFTVGNQLLTVHLTNAINGQALANKEIHVYQQQTDGSLKWKQKNTTNNQGQVNFDLDGIGNGNSYVLVTKAYGPIVISTPISKASIFDFKVGKVQIRLTDKNSHQPLISQSLVLGEKSSDGKLHWQVEHKTNSDGVVHFDPTELNTGKIYVVRAYNLYGNRKYYYSPWITTSGVVNFSVSPNEDYSADLNPPEITFISPSENAFVSDAGFEVKALVNDNEEINSVIYKVVDPIKGTSSGSITLVRGQWKFLATSSMLTTAKTVKVVIAATDNAQNVTEVTRQFQIIKDVEAPIVKITSHQNFDQVSENGFLLAGSVIDNTGVKEITASVVDPILGLVVNNKPLEISEDNGKWALSVREVSRSNKVQVSISSTDYAGNIATKQLSLNVMTNGLNGRQLIDRLTFGVTDELLEDIKTPSGAETFLYQQLHPESIDNSEFDATLAKMGDIASWTSLRNYQITHAIYSKHQLKEIMTWFWDNHFSTDIKKSRLNFELAENNAFRQNALGNFRDLLQISATSPAMMLYLDNEHNRKEEPNENYARELLELHTLGVNGGYTTKDVAEVARVFTGWNIYNDSFYFRHWRHDNDAKIVLGHTIPANLGTEGGNLVLDLLATHQSTSEFICTKILKLFVSDRPSTESIESCAIDFLNYAEKDDQITQVLENIFRSKYFAENKHFHNKVKTPLEFLSGFARQLPIQLSSHRNIMFLQEAGMTPFENPLPTGWSEVGEDWVSSEQYLQYIQFIFNSVLNNKASKWSNYFENPKAFFKDKGYETAEGIVGYLFLVALSNDYTVQEWDITKAILTEDDSKTFDINAEETNLKLRKLLATVLSFPTYQLQ